MVNAKIGPQSTTREIVEYLKGIGSESHKASVGRMGIPLENALGVPTANIRKLGKQIGKNSDLAQELWASGFHEARLLAVLTADPTQFSTTNIEQWLNDIMSWDLCDHLCKNLLLQIPYCITQIEGWAHDSREFIRRSAFTLIASMAIHQPAMVKDRVDGYLELIRDGAADGRKYVKKAVSWALREIGKSGFEMHEPAILLAYELCESEDRTECWVGKTALKELETLVSVPERRRLISSDSKMGRRV
jgi:3-methyladenine DNA glycosylase AlkD